MAISNRYSRWGKKPERFVFITSPFVYFGLLWFSYMVVGLDDCIQQVALGNETIDYYNGCVLGQFLFPIILGTSYLLTGIFLRRDRIKKEHS